MQEELVQLKRNNVWILVLKPDSPNIIGTKWILKNKVDESGILTKNKPRLVVQGYSQIEGIDFEETFTLVTRLEAIALCLAFYVYKSSSYIKWISKVSF